MPIIAVYPMTAGFGVEIVIVSDDNDYVVWKWTNELGVHRSSLKDGKFRANRTWISLDECMKMN